MKYSRNWVQEQFDEHQNLKYLFFWGHQPNNDGSISKSCFSQWWPTLFETKGLTFKTAEHWMMHQKAVLFNDGAIAGQILTASTPGEAKKLGRKVSAFDPVVWDEKKYSIVKDGNFLKFSQNKELQEVLLQTGNRILVEASPVDAIWGIGMSRQSTGVENPYNWRGDNLLGFALMEVRDALKEKL